MAFCCTFTQTWVRNLKIRDEYKQFTVQLRRQIGCYCEEYEIFVNGQQLESHGLSYNPCSPLCCPGGEYEWEQDGHVFLLTFNSLSFTRRRGNYRLFVDGIDVVTELEYSAFWRRRGYQFMVLALFLVVIGVAWTLVFRYVVDGSQRIHFFGYAIICGGIIAFVKGMIPVLKFRNQRYADRFLVEDTPNIV